MNNYFQRIFLITSLILTSLSSLSLQAQCIFGDCQNGFGTYRYESGNQFTGNWENAQRKKGVFRYANGDRYEGTFQNNKRHGKGVFQYAKSGNRFEGTYHQGKKQQGTFYYADGSQYNGHFLEDKKEGWGRLQTKKGVVYEGYWFADAFLGANSNDLHEDTYAVLVGVADYQNPKFSLQISDKDAIAFYHFLKSEAGGYVPESHIQLLTNEQATEANILAALEQQFSKASPKDKILFFFSGHGDSGYFLPYDFNPYASNSHTLKHQDIKKAFKKSAAKTKFCLADACYSGSMRTKHAATNNTTSTKALEKELNTKLYKQFFEINEGVVAFMSSKAQEPSYENHQIGISAFTHALLEGMKGQGDNDKNRILTIEELYVYVRKRIKQLTPEVQSPVLFGKFSMKMPVALF